MVENTLLKRLVSATKSIEEFDFDKMMGPPLLSLLTVQDIEYFNYLATSIKYSAQIDYKYKEIDRIMRARGFVKLSAGTNRVVYRFLEDQSFVVKIAIDNVGLLDSPREFVNQQIFKPFVSKIFEVSPCGTVAVVERVRNIRSREEFASIAGDIYDLITQWFIGEYILEDIGTDSFMNWGVTSRGPVLLDFPYVYKLDGNKLYCNKVIDGQPCDGIIDYDEGFNRLFCKKCGTEYKAVDLKKYEEQNLIIKKGKEEMEVNVIIKRGDKVIKTSEDKGKKKISKRERIYNSLPAAGDGIVVRCHGGKLADKQMKEAVEKAEEEVQEVSLPVENNTIPGGKEPVYEENQKIPCSKPEILDGPPVRKEEPDNSEDVDDNFDTHSKFIPQEEYGETEDREYKEEHLSLDPTDEESIPDKEEEPDYSQVPVGAVPVGQIKQNKKSQRFNPEFYKR